MGMGLQSIERTSEVLFHIILRSDPQQVVIDQFGLSFPTNDFPAVKKYTAVSKNIMSAFRDQSLDSQSLTFLFHSDDIITSKIARQVNAIMLLN